MLDVVLREIVVNAMIVETGSSVTCCRVVHGNRLLTFWDLDLLAKQSICLDEKKLTIIQHAGGHLPAKSERR